MTVQGNNEPWFVAKDVCEILGYVNPWDAVAKHCKNAQKINLAEREGKRGNPLTVVIPESDLYRLILRSNMPVAEEFQAWVVEEVLPQIRKTGGYIPVTADDDDLIIMAEAFLISLETASEKRSRS